MKMGKTGAFGHTDAVVISWRVPKEFEGMRADLYLPAKVGRLSRARTQKLISSGDFRTREGPLKPSQRMKAGALLELWRIPPDSPGDFGSEPPIVFEDDCLLVLDKPTGLSIHPSARYLYRTLTYWLKVRGNGTPCAHPCHRIDRETSGLVLCAKTKVAESTLKKSFMEGAIEKLYLAIVDGHLQEAQTIRKPLALQGERGLVRIRMIEDEAGLPCQTNIQPVFYDKITDRTVVACWPKTGRQHQIRAHLHTLGFSITGDKLYGMGDAYFDAYTRSALGRDAPRLDHHRHALHAFGIFFRFQSHSYRFFSEVPDDFHRLLSGDWISDGLRPFLLKASQEERFSSHDGGSIERSKITFRNPSFMQ
jgi:23S rRNA pseudouridine1911/1915/1917 synthase